jgi:hypothetical protein
LLKRNTQFKEPLLSLTPLNEITNPAKGKSNKNLELSQGKLLGTTTKLEQTVSKSGAGMSRIVSIQEKWATGVGRTSIINKDLTTGVKDLTKGWSTGNETIDKYIEKIAWFVLSSYSRK